MRLLLSFSACFLALSLNAQVPQGIGYQGVATDPQGLELTNQSISVRASILSGSVNGEVQWQETHSTSTDDFGLFALTIGEGANTEGGQLAGFADIPWGENTYFLQIEMDASGGDDYILMGVNQMMSVPYALHAETAESAPTDFDSIVNYLLQDATFVENFTTILSADSVFVSNVTSLNGGNCNFLWPDGIYGEPITMFVGPSDAGYTVPEGKTLYVTNLYWPTMLSNFSDTLQGVRVNGHVITKERYNNSNTNYNGLRGNVLHAPIVVGAGEVIDCHQGYSFRFNGLLIDAVAEAITISMTNGETYAVPEGKLLVVMNAYSNSGFYIGGQQIFARANLGTDLGSPQYLYRSGMNLGMPLFAGEGEVLSTSDNVNVTYFTVLNGYLVDEDYFEGCD